ncbi:Appr-1-p processing domain protein [Magnetococcus marinus MC-1]|uniref:Appr-1-p processing domain protein n=1 Tax=Magnetococcus marinus (strain ATCC BAA-1437 / JCM 17883 / MC-1) TaxID=156889 RepID=A0L536_MAGMM|nr:O-acetyl-ADP-ribose deacetylase [Magnetococcus marinus]ABK43079.1 Appr-1-p processing domain protein [Magnetococcus marinus MC-1]
MTTLEIILTDITQLPIDGVVNAANNSLLGGMGVDGAIHRVGGTALTQACQALRHTHYPDGLATGAAVATCAGELPAKRVIHTVGPVYAKDPDPQARLADCYRNSLRCAQEEGLRSIAFPAISTGVYGFPKQQAANIAVATLLQALREGVALERVVLVAFSEEDAQILRHALNQAQHSIIL